MSPRHNGILIEAFGGKGLTENVTVSASYSFYKCEPNAIMISIIATF